MFAVPIPTPDVRTRRHHDNRYISAPKLTITAVILISTPFCHVVVCMQHADQHYTVQPLSSTVLVSANWRTHYEDWILIQQVGEQKFNHRFGIRTDLSKI